MEKKKSKKFKILFFIFVAIFITGIIGIAIPFDYEDYSYSVTSTSCYTNGFENTHKITINVDLLNSGRVENAIVQIDFKYLLRGETKNVSINTEQALLKKGLNKFKIEFTDDGWGTTLFSGVESVRIYFSDDTSVKIYSSPLFSQQNLAFFSCIVIGFIAGAVTLILWKANKKVFVDPVEESIGTTIGNTIGDTMRTFEERIKEAFKPVSEQNKTKQNEKLICSYCKCSFDGEKYDKCPHCGAPPERKG